MNATVAAGLLVIALATPVLAAGANSRFAVIDTVGNCSVIDSKPGAGSGLKLLGQKGGYDNEYDAQKAFGSQCKGQIDPM